MPAWTPEGPATPATHSSALLVLVITVFGFLLPMLFIYPPVSPQPSDFLSETHSKLGDEQEADEADIKDDKTWRISDLYVYPIQACRGIRHARGRLLPTGMEFDRLFAFAQLQTPFPARAGVVVGEPMQTPMQTEKSQDSTWETITQHQFPRLATLQVELWRPDVAKAKRAQKGMRAAYRAEREPTMGDTFAVVRFPWGAEEDGAGAVERLWAWTAAKLARGWHAQPEMEVVLPVVDVSAVSAPGGATRRRAYANVRMAGQEAVRALDLSAELPPELRRYLGVSNRLGFFQWAPQENQKTEQPLVRLRNGTDTPAAQDTRANIILSGVPPMDETLWKTISFKPQKSSLPDADSATCHVSATCAGLDVQLTPVFGQTDQPELLEHMIAVGMAVEVLEATTR